VDTAAATHVVLFDFPRDPSELLRRAGRVARGGEHAGATVSMLVLGRQVPLARRVIERGDAGLPLHAVPGGGSIIV
jgi:ATP-dependent RNA helicase DDX18/HAS1